MRRFAIAALAITLAGCSSSNENSVAPIVAPSISGSYTLQSMNGSSLPYTWPNGTGTVLTSFQITLNTDGTFKTALTHAGKPQGPGDTGTWTAENDAVTLMYTSSGLAYNASSDGTLMTLQFGGGVVGVLKKDP